MSLKSAAEKLFHSLGAVDLVRFRKRQRVRILMYHRFQRTRDPGEAQLIAQCEHIRRHYYPITLDEIAQAAQKGRPLPENSVAITVDDGYRDFGSAFSVFEKYGLKVTLYVVSGFAAGEIWLWPDQLLYMIEKTELPVVTLPFPDGTCRLETLNRSRLFDHVAQALIGMKNQDRLNFLRTLPAAFETELPQYAPERFAALSWAELRALASRGLDIGSHTVSHPILSKIEGGVELRREISDSKTRIERETGVKVRHFCYPNGQAPDLNDQAVAVARDAGYQTAVLAQPGMAGPPFDLFRLKRIPAEPDHPPLYFQRCLAGYRL